MHYIFKIFSIALLLSFASQPVSAFNYGLYVGGRQVVGSDSTFNVTADGKIKYDPRTRTLTLRDAVLRDTVCAIHNERIDGLTILLEGTDSIFTTGADGLRLERRTVIRSATHDGQLCISTSKAKGAKTSEEAAVRVSGGSTLLIADCYVKMSSDGYALKSEKSDSLSIVTAEVTAQARKASRSCIDGFRDISFTAVNASNNEMWNSKTRSLCTPVDSLPVQSALIQGNLYIGRLIVDVTQTAKEQTITDASTGLTRGKLKYDGRYQRLTLSNATLRVAGTYAIRNTAMKFLSLSIQGSDTITSNASDVISMLCSTSIEGNGRHSSRLVVKGAASGIYQGGQPFGYFLTIRDVDMQVEGSVEGIHGQTGYSQLVFDNARVRVYRASASSSSFKAITAFASCEMTNDDNANGTAWRKATGNFDRNDGSTAREVVVDVPTAYYPLTINGRALNNVNSSEIAVDGVEGGGLAYYDAGSKTLMMANISFDYPGGTAISTSDPGLTISVSGTNTVTAHYGIQVNGPARITGPGALTILATNTAIVDNAANTFTIDCASLTARGAVCGFDNGSKGTLRLVAPEGQAETVHTFSGIHGNIRTAEMLYSDMDLSSPAYCYFDHDASTFKLNGNRAVNAELVFRQVTARYGVSILGVEINNCNAKGVGSPYIDSRNFMSFDEATLTLTLKDFKVENNEGMQIISSSCDGLRVRLEGESTLTTSAGAVIKVSNPSGEGRVETVFCGDGKLNLKGRNFAVLIGANAGVTFTDQVVVRGEGAIGGNNLGEKEETLTVEEDAYVSCKGSFNNPAVEQLASLTLGGRVIIVKPNHGSIEKLDNGYCVLDLAGEPAREVIFGKAEGMGMYIGERQVTTANYTDVYANGQFSYDPETRTLTLKDVQFELTSGVRASGIDNAQIDGLNIVIVGDNNITVQNSVIRSEKFFTITGEGTLNGTSTAGVAMKLFGFDCVVTGPTINLMGKTYAVRGDRAIERLRVMDTRTQMTMKTEGRATLSGLRAVVVGPGLYITSPVEAVFNENYGGFTVNGELWNGKVEISCREPSDIGDVACGADLSAPAAVYDTSGRRLKEQKRGLNIMRMTDGTVRKQVVR